MSKTIKRTIESPISKDNLIKLINFLNLKPQSSVFDIGCGFGEFLISVSEKYDISGLGIDINKEKINSAIELKQQRVPNRKLEFIKDDIFKYIQKHKINYDVVSCIGTWAGFPGIDFLSNLIVESGLIIIGLNYWRLYPPESYFSEFGHDEYENDFKTLEKQTEFFINKGFFIKNLFSCSKQERDDYQNFFWYKKTNIDIKKNKENWLLYTKWLRDYHGWGIWVLEKNAQ